MELFLNSYCVPLCPSSQVTWWGRRASRACLNCRRQTVTTSHPQRQRGSQSWTGTRPCWRLWCNKRTNNRWCQKLPKACCFGCAAAGEKRRENISERSVCGLYLLSFNIIILEIRCFCVFLRCRCHTSFFWLWKCKTVTPPECKTNPAHYLLKL